jgi:hypothetical protein
MNQEHTIMNKIPAIYSLLLIFTAGLVCADDPGGKSIAKSASAKSTAVAALSKPSLRGDKDWSLELGSGILVSDIRTDNTGYTFIPVNLTAALKLDDVTLDNVYGGMFRGYTEWVLRGFGTWAPGIISASQDGNLNHSSKETWGSLLPTPGG